MPDFKPNGVARIAWKVRWAGIAERFGKDPNEEGSREERVRITDKLIRTRYAQFDRATGKDRSGYSPGIKPRRVAAYKLDGQEEWTEVKT
jgi:hypothetical protein